jgi:molybdopterin-binding protein
LLAAPDTDIGPTSARNRLRGIVDVVEPRGATWHVVIQLDGARIASSVSRAALDEMGLVPGSPVQTIFKATAVRVRAAD